MGDQPTRRVLESAFLESVKELLVGGDWSGREQALALFNEIEAQLLELVSLPPERLPRAQRALEAQLLGLIELARLEALSLRRQAIIEAVSLGLQLVRRLIVKL